MLCVCCYRWSSTITTRFCMASDLDNADQHIHTTASDGLLTPTEVVREAAIAGVRCLAVTDHDTVAGLGEASREARLVGLEFMPGIEVSAWRHGREIHVLGYGVRSEERRVGKRG